MSGYKYSLEHNTDLDNVYEIGTNTRTTGFLKDSVDIGTRYKSYSYGYNKHIKLAESSNANDSIYTYQGTNINTFFQLKDSNYFTVTNGTRITNVSYNYVYKYTTNGTIKFYNNTKVYIVAIGGGGGGGANCNNHNGNTSEGGGGGGGGGSGQGYVYCLANITYNIAIGAGGTSYHLNRANGGGSNSNNGENGGDTTFSDTTITFIRAKGGGGGGSSRIKVGKNGGCGGGSCGYYGNAAGGGITNSSFTNRASQNINYIDSSKPVVTGNKTQTGMEGGNSGGNIGGTGIQNSGGGGGGGLGTAGSASTGRTGGTGGNGANVFGTVVGGGGGGGGGGSRDAGGNSGVGGSGGGGNGEANTSWAQHGTDGTGSGGGGCSSNGNVGGLGGTGILFIAF